MIKLKAVIINWRKPIFLLVLILLVGFVIRIYNLTIIPVFADEAIYIRWAQVMGAEPTLRFLPLSDGKQPFFMWVLMFIVRRFTDPLFISRLTSVFYGMATIVGIFTASFLLFKNHKVSLVASLIYALSPFAIFFDRMALVDSMLSMFGIWTFVFAIITAKTKRIDAAMVTGFLLGFAMLTKSPAVFFMVMLPTTWLLTKINFKNLLKLSGLALISYLIAFGLYNILRLGPNFQMIGARNFDYVFPLSHLWTNPKDPFIFLIDRVREWLWIMGIGVVCWLFLGGIFANIKKLLREILVLIIWFLFPILVQSEFAKVFTARYIFFTLPFFFILSASAFLTTNKKLNLVFTAIFVIFIAQSFIFNKNLLTNPQAADLPSGERSGYLEEWTSGYGIKEVSEYLKMEHAKNPDKQIVVGTEGFFGTLPDGLQMYMEGTPKVVIIGVGVTLSDVHQSLKDSKKAGNKTYLVVNNSRFKPKDSVEDLGLKLLASYPKGMRPEWTKEYLQNGPREELLFFEVVK